MTTANRDYKEFDKKMLALIGEGGQTASRLTIALDAEAKQLVSEPGDEFRVVDRRLQALRKKGVIEWMRNGREIVWSIAG